MTEHIGICSGARDWVCVKVFDWLVGWLINWLARLGCKIWCRWTWWVKVGTMPMRR